MNVVKAGLIKVRYIMEIGDFPNDFFCCCSAGTIMYNKYY